LLTPSWKGESGTFPLPTTFPKTPQPPKGVGGFVVFFFQRVLLKTKKNHWGHFQRVVLGFFFWVLPNPRGKKKRCHEKKNQKKTPQGQLGGFCFLNPNPQPARGKKKGLFFFFWVFCLFVVFFCFTKTNPGGKFFLCFFFLWDAPQEKKKRKKKKKQVVLTGGNNPPKKSCKPRPPKPPGPTPWAPPALDKTKKKKNGEPPIGTQTQTHKAKNKTTGKETNTPPTPPPEGRGALGC